MSFQGRIVFSSVQALTHRFDLSPKTICIFYKNRCSECRRRFLSITDREIPVDRSLRGFSQLLQVLIGQPPPQRGRKPHPRHIPPVVKKSPLGKLAERHLQDQTLDLGLGKLGDPRHARPRLLRGKTAGHTVQVEVAEAAEGERRNGHCSVLVHRIQQTAQEHGLVRGGHVHLVAEPLESLADVGGSYWLQTEALGDLGFAVLAEIEVYPL